MADLPEPISDQDLLLHNIAVGNPDISDLEPNSRQEEYLKYIALNGTSGGGGGGSSVNVVQERGESTTDVMSQNAVSNLTIFGPNASAYTDGVAIGNGTKSGSTSITIGKSAYALNGGNIAIGANSKTNNDLSIALGYNCNCNGGYSVAIGGSTTLEGSSSTGDNAYSVTIGAQSGVKASRATAVGDWARVYAQGGTAIGSSAQVNGENSTAIGYAATVSENVTNAVAIGYGSQATESNTLSVGTELIPRRIVNIDTPVNDSDAATKGYVDNALAARSVNAISALSDETDNISYTGPVVLYETQEGTQQDITLSDSPSNYEYLEIYFHNDLSQYNSVKVTDPTNKYISLGIIGYSNNKIVVECAEVKVTESCVIWQDNHVGEQTLSPENILTTTNNYIFIDKVVGYPK